MMGQYELSDNVDETELTQHKCKRETLVSPLHLLLEVEQEVGLHCHPFCRPKKQFLIFAQSRLVTSLQEYVLLMSMVLCESV